MVALTEQQIFETQIKVLRDDAVPADVLLVERTLQLLFPATEQRDFHHAYVKTCKFYGLMDEAGE